LVVARNLFNKKLVIVSNCHGVTTFTAARLHRVELEISRVQRPIHVKIELVSELWLPAIGGFGVRGSKQQIMSKGMR
jgi:hypothetical protein